MQVLDFLRPYQVPYRQAYCAIAHHRYPNLPSMIGYKAQHSRPRSLDFDSVAIGWKEYS